MTGDEKFYARIETKQRAILKYRLSIQKVMLTWHRAIERALEHQLYRQIHLARTNPDYQRKYPSEVKANPQGKILTHCSIEAKKRCEHEQEVRIRHNFMPVVERPKRLNRSG